MILKANFHYGNTQHFIKYIHMKFVVVQLVEGILLKKRTAMTGTKKDDVLFKELTEDASDPGTTEIESACMQCFESGITRLLLTKIPFFKEVVLMSFKCEHCGFENTEIQSAAEIQVKAVRYELHVIKPEDLNRRVVSSDYTSILIPEVELEIPAQSQKGQITTVEGILNRTVNGLEQDQEKRRIEHPDAAAAIDAFVVRLNDLRSLKKPFHLHLEDLSGNCFIENPNAPAVDGQLKVTHFTRTAEQDKLLGIYVDNKLTNTDYSRVKAAEKHLLKPIAEGDWTLEDLHGEVMQFHTKCSDCGAPCETNMKLTNIPHFKEVIIMATTCDECGNKTNEVKSGGGVEEHGVRFEVRVENGDDLSRDVLKSETCSLRINELDCEVGPSALEGRFTTIEGILVAMKAQLQGDGILFDDSADPEATERMKKFLIKFDDIIKLKMPATIILDDPAGNSYVQSLCDDDNETDEKLKIIKYKRTFEQNEELGLNDIKTENYEQTS